MKVASYTMHRLATDENARRSVLAAVRAAPNGELMAIERTIAAYERKYGLNSDEVMRRVECSEMAATRDIESWLMAVRVRDDLASLTRR